MRVVCGGWRGGAAAVAAAWTMCWAPASAAVVSQLQLTAGGQYVATLRDTELVDFEAADLRISYSGSRLRFVSGTVGTLDSLDSAGSVNFAVDFGVPSTDGFGQTLLLASVFHGLATTASGDFEILRLVFDPLAGGPVSVSFATDDASLYDFTPTTATLDGTPSPVPEGHSAGLVAAALAALWLSGRQRRR